MERTGERTYERALPRRFLRAGRGQGAQTPPPRPAPPPPLSSSATKSLTDADHFGMIRTAQRRFAPTVIGITRNSDRHQIGMSDRHRRNTQLLQAMIPIWEPRFSAHSYGFRPGRKAADAVRAAQRYAETGKDWVVDLDIAKFFDHVNWDILMGKIAQAIRDKRVLKLIGRYLRVGAMVEGVMRSEEP